MLTFKKLYVHFLAIAFIEMLTITSLLSSKNVAKIFNTKEKIKYEI